MFWSSTLLSQKRPKIGQKCFDEGRGENSFLGGFAKTPGQGPLSLTHIPLKGSGRLLWHGYELRRLASLRGPVTQRIRLVTQPALLDAEKRD